MNKNLVSFLFFVLFTTGCQQNIVSPEGATPDPESQVDSIKNDEEHHDGTGGANVLFADEESIDNSQNINAQQNLVINSEPESEPLTPYEALTLRLLEQGQKALASERLLTPEDDNANLYFQAALGRNPGNFTAIQGIANIVDIYTDWAWTAAKNRFYKKAERYLDHARSVNPEDPLIEEMTSRIVDLKAQRQRTTKSKTQEVTPLKLKEGQYLLPKTLFSLTEDEIITEIQPIIEAVSKTGQSIEIHWPRDKEARLIYQIINSRIPEFRVRAMTYRRADYMVELQQD